MFQTPQLWGYCLACGAHRHIFRQDAIFHETDRTVLGILVKSSWHIPGFPIYSNGTKPGTFQSAGGACATTSADDTPSAILWLLMFLPGLQLHWLKLHN